MSLTINANLASMGAQQAQARTQSDLSGAIARLSSGLRINTAGDDAAGLAIGARFTSQLRGAEQASRNANDAISLTQTADGALAAINDNLQRIRELAVQSANASLSSADRHSLQTEVSQLQSEIDRVATQTQFNGINLLDGSFAGKAFQIGADVGQTITVGSITSARSADLGTYQGFWINDHTIGIPSNTTYPYLLTIGGGAPIVLGQVADDANAVAAAINSSHVAGLSAQANPTQVNAVASVATASTSGTATYAVNGIDINIAGINGGAALGSNRTAAVAAINAQSAATGVTAADDGSGVTLTAQDGRNITLAYAAGSFAGSTASDFGLSAAAIAGSTFNFGYDQPPGVAGDLVFTFGGGPSTFVVGATGTPVAAMDVSTVAGANDALSSVDRALASVSTVRATLGAIQNRVVSTIGNLQTSRTSLSAARSRIVDADFAMETAKLARGQVLQQASTAMIAQANQLPSLVLALLKA